MYKYAISLKLSVFVIWSHEKVVKIVGKKVCSVIKFQMFEVKELDVCKPGFVKFGVNLFCQYTSVLKKVSGQHKF